MECIREIECLGEFCSCDAIRTGLASPVDGVLTIKAAFLSGYIVGETNVAQGIEITFANFLNDNYSHEVGFFLDGENIFDDKWFTIRTVPCVKGVNPTSSGGHSEYSNEYN